MNPFFRKTFGGLNLAYYLRHLVFGVAFAALIVFSIYSNRSIDFWTYLFIIVNTLLYPYSRFVYEQVMGFILGNTVFVFPIIILMMAKVFTMALCWFLAIFIAPLGLAYLYYYHTKQEKG